MSLLNDALKDLDRGRQPEASDSVKFATSENPFSRHAKIKKYALPALAALVALLWLAIEMDILGIMSKKAVVPDSIAPIALNSKWLRVDPQSAKVQPIGVEPLAVSRVTVADKKDTDITRSEIPTTIRNKELLPTHHHSPTDKASAGLHNGAEASHLQDIAIHGGQTNVSTVAQLLAAANKALQQDRLMMPVENNAYQLYRSVLAIEPDNSSALAGIASIQQRYLQLVEDALQAKQLSTAELYLQRATKAGASAQQTEHHRVMLAQNNATPVTGVGKNMQVKFDKDADLAQRLRQYPLAQYESKAWSLVESNAPSRGTVMALADAYAASQNQGQLRRLLSKVTYDKEPAVAAYVQAQWLVLNGDLRGAAQMLEPHVETLDSNPFHLRLLAGIWAGMNNYGAALPLYRQLVEMPEFSVNDWLGYAIALERVGERSAALHAYQRISRVRHTDRRINDYINERIRDLSAEY